MSRPIDIIEKCFEDGGIKIEFSTENLSIHIENSYKVKNGLDIRACLYCIYDSDECAELRAKGFKRTLESAYREWRAHNFLYRLGIMRKRTSHVDINNNEPKWRRFLYAILSVF